MAKFRAFQGLIPRKGKESEVACVPYDVVNRQEAFELAKGLPDSLLYVDRAEICLPETTPPYSDEVYATAKKNFQRLITEGILQRESQPCLYIYRQQIGHHTQTGVVGTCHIEDYENNIIKKHEKTRPDKEDDRTRLISILSAQTGPVFLTYRDQPDLDSLVTRLTQTAPLFNFIAPDGVRHALWRVTDTQPLESAFDKIPTLYIADGHHRSASAYRVGVERRKQNPNHQGTEEYNWFLCVLFPASQLQILPYNRLVKNLNNLTPAEFLAEVAKRTPLTPNAPPQPASPGRASMYLDGKWYAIELVAPPHADPVSTLDVSILQEQILAPILGINDPRTSDNIDFIGGIRGTKELVQRVDSGEGAVAFSLFPVTVQQLMAIADADQIMPPKSTWFEPKLRSGLFCYTF